MENKKNRKLSGVILTGTFIAPAVMSAAQQNVASANLGGLLRPESIKTGLNAAWANPVGRCSILFIGLVGFMALGTIVTKVSVERFEHILNNDENITQYNKKRMI